MSKLVMIRIVSSEKCERCAAVKQRIIDAAKKAGVKLAIQVFDSSSADAVNLGVEFGLDDVPSFVVKGKPFCGEDWQDADLENLMRG
jgi:uncharacterized Zn finger protein